MISIALKKKALQNFKELRYEGRSDGPTDFLVTKHWQNHLFVHKIHKQTCSGKCNYLPPIGKKFLNTQ